jgi:Tfp pilus assembly protein PilO
MKIGLREVVIAAMLLGVPVGAWYLVFRPANEHRGELRKQIEAKQQELQELKALTASVGNLKEEIASMEKTIALFRSKLPAAKEIDKVLQETSRLAEQNRLVTKSIRTGTVPQTGSSLYVTGSHSIQPIIIQLEGKFDGFYRFLQDLERQPRIMRIGLMSLKKAKDADEGTIQASFQMSVFFEPDEQGEG